MIYLHRDFIDPENKERLTAGQSYDSSKFRPDVLEHLIANNYAQVVVSKLEIANEPKKKGGRPKKQSYTTREMVV